MNVPAGELAVDATRLALAKSTFDNDLDGWGAIGDVTAINYHPTGGNPGGYVSAVDSHLGPFWYWNAPPPFRGNQAAVYGGWLEFDLKQSSTDAQQANPHDIILRGAALELFHDRSRNPGTSWSSYKIQLVESAGWTNLATLLPPTRQQFLLVLSNLTDIRIRGEYSTTLDTGDLDNAALVAPLPALGARVNGGQIVIEWPEWATGFQLEAGSGLEPGDWMPVTVVPAAGTGLNTHTATPPSHGAQFFRLRAR